MPLHQIRDMGSTSIIIFDRSTATKALDTLGLELLSTGEKWRHLLKPHDSPEPLICSFTFHLPISACKFVIGEHKIVHLCR